MSHGALWIRWRVILIWKRTSLYCINQNNPLKDQPYSCSSLNFSLSLFPCENINILHFFSQQLDLNWAKASYSKRFQDWRSNGTCRSTSFLTNWSLTAGGVLSTPQSMETTASTVTGSPLSGSVLKQELFTFVQPWAPTRTTATTLENYREPDTPTSRSVRHGTPKPMSINSS